MNGFNFASVGTIQGFFLRVQHGQHSGLGLSLEMNKTDTEVKTRGQSRD